MKLRNEAKGPRGINVRKGDKIAQLVIAVGEEVDVEVANPNDPVLLGLLKTRELVMADAPDPVVPTAQTPAPAAPAPAAPAPAPQAPAADVKAAEKPAEKKG